jgi:hypothetical protein
MNDSLENILVTRFNKDELISFISKYPAQFDKALKISLSDIQPQAWRAAWVLGHSIQNNDERIMAHIPKIIKAVKTKKDGHQRELIKILEKMDISEAHEGYLFDIYIKIWTDIYKSPSVRIVAFKALVRIVKKYPELINEIESLTQNHFTETLSPGIKHYFAKLVKELNGKKNAIK